MSTNKKLNFYHASKNSNGITVYKCLYMDSTVIKTVKNLDYELYKNFKSNQNYQQTDEDLFEFRDDLIRHNDEIKKHFFKTKDKLYSKLMYFITILSIMQYTITLSSIQIKTKLVNYLIYYSRNLL